MRSVDSLLFTLYSLFSYLFVTIVSVLLSTLYSLRCCVYCVSNYLVYLCSGVGSLGLPYEYSVSLFRSCSVGVQFGIFVSLVSGSVDGEVSSFVRGPRVSFTCNCFGVSAVYVRVSVR